MSRGHYVLGGRYRPDRTDPRSLHIRRRPAADHRRRRRLQRIQHLPVENRTSLWIAELAAEMSDMSRHVRRTALTDATTTALFIFDALAPALGEAVQVAADALTDALSRLSAITVTRRLIATP